MGDLMQKSQEQGTPRVPLQLPFILLQVITGLNLAPVTSYYEEQYCCIILLSEFGGLLRNSVSTIEGQECCVRTVKLSQISFEKESPGYKASNLIVVELHGLEICLEPCKLRTFRGCFAVHYMHGLK